MLRPLKKKHFDNDDDNADPAGYYRWDTNSRKMNSISAPESPCGCRPTETRC